MPARRPSSAAATRGVSVRVLKTLAMFGLTLEDVATGIAGGAVAAWEAEKLDDTLRPGEIATVMGFSGAGKTSMLNALAARVRSRSEQVVWADPPWRIAQRAGAAIDLVCGDHDWLSRVGLADVRHMCIPVGFLSEGERARLALAAAMRKASLMQEPVTLLVDEFGGALDDHAAAVLGYVVRRCISPGAHTRMVVATHRPVVPIAMAADVQICLASALGSGRSRV